MSGGAGSRRVCRKGYAARAITFLRLFESRERRADRAITTSSRRKSAKRNRSGILVSYRIMTQSSPPETEWQCRARHVPGWVPMISSRARVKTGDRRIRISSRANAWNPSSSPASQIPLRPSWNSSLSRSQKTVLIIHCHGRHSSS